MKLLMIMQKIMALNLPIFLKKAILWSALFNNIELDFIESQFETLDADQVERLTLAFPEFSKKPLIFLNVKLFKRCGADLGKF